MTILMQIMDLPLNMNKFDDLTNLWVFEVVEAVVVGGRVMVAKSL